MSSRELRETDRVTFIAAIDQGTTSSRCMVFDATARVVAADQREHRQLFPRPEWVEHDAAEIWRNVQGCVTGALQRAGIAAADLAAIGITNQRETTVLWDRRTGAPVHPAIVWQDTRTDGIVTALGALFPDREVEINEFRAGAARPLGSQRSPARRSLAAMPPVPPGSDPSAAIVLLTDGQNTQGIDPLKAARLAADRGIKVYTVGYGTRDGEVISPEGYAVSVRLDEDTLQQIARMTGAEYFHAADGSQLAGIYRGLKGRLVTEAKDTEVTALFAAASALLLLAGLGLSLWWSGRP